MHSTANLRFSRFPKNQVVNKTEIIFHKRLILRTFSRNVTSIHIPRQTYYNLMMKNFQSQNLGQLASKLKKRPRPEDDFSSIL